MIAIHGSCRLANGLIVDHDDERCGLCFGDAGVPVQPPHAYQQHTEVVLPTERFDIVTDRYVLWGWGGGVGVVRKEGFEASIKRLQASGYSVLGCRRIRHATAHNERPVDPAEAVHKDGGAVRG